jgi:glycine dehydrogenase subunit 2
VTAELASYLPGPVPVAFDDGTFGLDWPEFSIGRVRSFYGNFGVLVRAYTYVRALGADGLRDAAELAVLSANYLRVRLKEAFELPYDRICMHEFVLSGARQKRESGVRTLDMAKRLLDHGFHPPTVYFPLLVDEALMIEPTETEPLSELDAFAEAMLAIAREAADDPEMVKHAPYTTPVRRLDEAGAARQPDLRWRPVEE